MSRLIRTHLPENKIREYCARQPIRRLSVFGSALRGELRDDSDIDLLVEYEADAAISLFDMGGHLTDLSEIIGRRVDLCTPDGLSPYVRDEIVESAKLIYAKES
ncbi:MAG: nucleotidyltransferase family protein [Anaerolineaceae bacterium]|nr:nucleotidyltransferase family protein [Anaerolineaceae bacterium]MDE0328057.1 nucleotidyltransferase family protein [Anaerolineaceae bacterium]